jgi:hypothetical protein
MHYISLESSFSSNEGDLTPWLGVLCHVEHHQMCRRNEEVQNEFHENVQGLAFPFSSDDGDPPIGPVLAPLLGATKFIQVTDVNEFPEIMPHLKILERLRSRSNHRKALALDDDLVLV